ncbi:P-loop nucleoside triphosphate hydrolasessuperfamily protein with CH (Calponin Homology) domain [Striga asiatica]|uniref:P-loop nucleoside triphosphate hydrolasessuperfamily protein with CH (Calponin Homology) domain n=1 Tax=Striga asiatica TaxID=4170 RepID=A0A5A7P1M4_STRAF|nr:P-loop nucleoside triphosphate hydrolasessuperfamily protein with CH (Calponin Homology) domain [Striga asiatica]
MAEVGQWWVVVCSGFGWSVMWLRPRHLCGSGVYRIAMNSLLPTLAGTPSSSPSPIAIAALFTSENQIVTTISMSAAKLDAVNHADQQRSQRSDALSPRRHDHFWPAATFPSSEPVAISLSHRRTSSA